MTRAPTIPNPPPVPLWRAAPPRRVADSPRAAATPLPPAVGTVDFVDDDGRLPVPATGGNRVVPLLLCVLPLLVGRLVRPADGGVLPVAAAAAVAVPLPDWDVGRDSDGRDDDEPGRLLVRRPGEPVGGAGPGVDGAAPLLLSLLSFSSCPFGVCGADPGWLRDDNGRRALLPPVGVPLPLMGRGVILIPKSWITLAICSSRSG